MKAYFYLFCVTGALAGLNLVCGCSSDPLAGTERNLASAPLAQTPQQLQDDQPAAAENAAGSDENFAAGNVPVTAMPPKKINTEGAGWLERRIQKMQAEDVMSAGGVSRVHGVYFIARVKLDADDRPEAELREMALVMGKRAIAAFLKQDVKSEEQSEYTEKVHNDKVEIREFYKSLTETKVEQLLRGVALYQLTRKGNQVHAICYVTGKSMDLSKQLQQQMRQLPPDTVGAYGFAAVEGGRLRKAREEALHAALRNAVEQVLGTVVSSNTQVHDATLMRSRIFAQSRGFVEHYRIVAEGVVDGSYRVELIAKVARNMLLQSYSAYLKQFGDPEFFVRTDNLELYQTFVKFFQELGLKIVADEAQAAYIIDAIGDFRDVEHPTEQGLIGTQLTLWIRIFDANTNQELLSQKNDPKRATEFRMAREKNRQKDLAASRAFKQIKNPLHENLNRMIADMSSNGRNILVVINRYNPQFLDTANKINDALTFVVGNDSVVMKIDAERGALIFTANYIGQMADLEKALKLRLKKDYPQGVSIPETRSMNTNKLYMSF